MVFPPFKIYRSATDSSVQLKRVSHDFSFIFVSVIDYSKYLQLSEVN